MLTDRPGPSRVKGRPALLKRLRGLCLATQRYGRHRARTEAEMKWAAELMTRLIEALQGAEEEKR